MGRRRAERAQGKRRKQGKQGKRDALPEPTRGQARAVVLGVGGYWCAWGVGIAGLRAEAWVLVTVAFAVGFPLALWGLLGGAFSLLGYRRFGTFDPAGWQMLGRAVRVFSPAYLRRCCSVAGLPSWLIWCMYAVLAVDLALGAVMIVDPPATATEPADRGLAPALVVRGG